MLFLRFRHAAAHVQRRTGLAGARNVVQLAFDRHDAGGGDVARLDALQLAIDRHHIPGAVDQLEFLKHRLDGFQVVIGVHVEHGVVFVIELAVRFGAGTVALDQVLEVVVMAGRVAIRVHRHKACVLQKAGINAAARAGEAAGHAVNHIVFKPLVRLGGGQVVHGGGRQARINRAAHHDHRQRRGFATRGHQRDGGKHRHRGLAHADDVAVAVLALQVADEFLHVVDIVVEVESAVGQRHIARIFPVGDIDLVVLEHGLDGVAQQG